MSQTSEAELWTLAYATLIPKRDDSRAETLNRLANERFDGMSALELNARTCSIREEVWATELFREVEPKHAGADPKRDGGVIIVVECRGRKLLVDGNNRVNRWLKEGSRDSHRVLVIECRGEQGDS